MNLKNYYCNYASRFAQSERKGPLVASRFVAHAPGGAHLPHLWRRSGGHGPWPRLAGGGRRGQTFARWGTLARAEGLTSRGLAHGKCPRASVPGQVSKGKCQRASIKGQVSQASVKGKCPKDKCPKGKCPKGPVRTLPSRRICWVL